MVHELQPATLGGHDGTGIIYVKRAPDGAVTEAAGRWITAGPERPEDLFDAYRSRRPVRYVGQVEDANYPEKLAGAELDVLIVLIQENKSLQGKVVGYTFILDPVRPLTYEALEGEAAAG